MATPTRMEFAVHMTCNTCVDKVKDALNGVEGIDNYMISLAEEQVIIDSALPMAQLHNLLVTTGLTVIMRGQGAATEGASHLGAAVSILSGTSVKGLVRFTQLSADKCMIEGTVDNLRPGNYDIKIHEYGDLSDGCNNCGDIFNPYEYPHGNNNTSARKLGDIGSMTANKNGRAMFRIEDDTVKVWDVIGRSVIIHDKQVESSGKSLASRITCGIIARSAGLFENSKKFCACDGKTLWEDKPLTNKSPQASL
ncbi:Copper chaperone for superoxide dismutase [Trichoplax sp. H2]|uniref:Superoxide dismutase 1 copper chaperone n=1 Tax=Trichoplax adhaerens TaxID=10228 RepID=B3S214_TRIAD|nr:hypothetical protein TRIADDRAFT_58413 [Trichoplax adhaerens]EDV23287.1 hypothetical protein TRIADDRAFT_58413 [Trichoplax adhaerens]RDD37588.1 Copper chaperone for superoxide dismutase [Trichoplax sp. H2]|eukprot:XP_002114197.1 hypothetical protein TRIADDRAFT_58413 [Trichoplax adhaerens]